MAKAPLSESDLDQWRVIEAFNKALSELGPIEPAQSSWLHSERNLKLSHYLSLFLFGLVNPVFKTTNALCQGTKFVRVRREVCGNQSVSLGSFSEAQHLVDPAWLERLLANLTAQGSGSAPTDPQEAWQQWLARDGSLLPALPRMHWALFGGGKAKKSGAANNAVRLHLSFNLLEDKPVMAQVTNGKFCERKSWKSQWKSGAAYVGDTYYAEDYQCLRDLDKKRCAYILRLRDEAVVRVLEELAVSAADRRAGVIRQAIVQLGRKPCDRVEKVRVVWVQTATAGILRLVTNLPVTQAPAELISVMYRRRWQIEGFFKWLKCLLGCRHWFAESQRGVTIQIYLALIAAVLLQGVTGRRPTKRQMELIQAYQMGWATLEEVKREVLVHHERTKSRAEKKS